MTHLLEGAHIQLNGRSQGEERRFVDALGSRGRVLLVTGERALQAALDAAAAKNAARRFPGACRQVPGRGGSGQLCTE